MKTYKTWEAIRTLTNNPKSVFKNKQDRKMQVVAFHNIHINDWEFNIDDTWELVQEPVSIEVAAKAFMNGKNIRCEYPDFTNKSNIITEIFTHSGSTCSMEIDAPDITFYMMIEGKWFIEEDNINE